MLSLLRDSQYTLQVVSMRNFSERGHTGSLKCDVLNCSSEVARLLYYRPQRSWGKVIFSQASVILFTGEGVVSHHALQVVSQHALQQVSREGVVSQHAFQVSRLTPKGKVERDLARGVSKPTPEGVCSGGSAPRGCLVPGGTWSWGGGGVWKPPRDG